MNKCPVCGVEYEGNYCPNGCNAPKVCPKCGTQFVGNFCPNGCSNNNKKKGKMKAWQIVLIVIGAIFVFGIIVGIIGSQGKSDDKSSDVSITASITEKTVDTNGATEKVSDKTEEKKTSENTTAKTTVKKTESKDEYISSCESISYGELARNPDKYVGKKIKVEIEVMQIMSGGWFTSGGYRGYSDYEFDYEDSSSTFLKKEWYINYDIPDGEAKILEGDVVMFYGEYQGTETVKRALTNTSDDVPCLKAKYHIITKAAD